MKSYFIFSTFILMNIFIGAEAASRNLLFSGNPMTQKAVELRVRGKGFLVFTKASGDRVFTKQALLQPDAVGQLVNEDEYLLHPVIAMNPKHALDRVDRSGVITTVNPEKTIEESTAGQIVIANFRDPSALTPIGGGYYKETSNSGTHQLGNAGLWGSGDILVVSTTQPGDPKSAAKK